MLFIPSLPSRQVGRVDAGFEDIRKIEMSQGKNGKHRANGRLAGRRRKQAYGAKTVGHFMAEVTRPVFEKFGFQRAALLTDWESIIGEPLCHFTAPEQIKWPQRRDAAVDAEQAGQKSGATLVIRVEGPAALEVQHQAPQIIERINGYFGFRAVGDIRILQAPLTRKPGKAKVKRYDLDAPIDREAVVAGVDDQLETALKRLWRGIQSRKINDEGKN